jgi:tetratricopeptide (TPR) repeat protein
MNRFALAMVTAFFLRAQAPGLYPQVRALVLEAEAASANMHLLKDNSNPHTWAGDILAHAGYLEDAERAYARSPGTSAVPPYPLWRAWVVYGQRERAEKLLESVTGAEKRANYFAAFADLLWRMGQPQEARARYESGRAIAVKIVDPAKRKQALALIDQGLQFVSEPPPYLVSTTPNPRPRFRVEDSPVPPFPITTGGFRDVDPKETADRASVDAELMKRLYDRAAAGDRTGIEKITENAATPFQEALGLASLEHVLIQARQPETAEQYARKIPETDSASSLAKAEALSAAAVAWLRARDADRARADFESAKHIVSSVSDLPFGRISVLVSIAAAQFKGEMMDDGNTTLRSAIELAQKLPQRPHTPPGVRRPQTPLGVHYKDEAFDKIVRAAIHARAVQIANDAAEIWGQTGDNTGSALVDAWLADGRTDEAIAAARRIKDPEWRVSALLSLARNLLTDDGAPIF